MANKTLFRNTPGRMAPVADTRNEAGGRAYSLPPFEALAQYAATGCLGNTFYASADEQLDKVLDFAGKCSPEFVAKCAVYARESGRMKDMPALLAAHLTTRGPDGLAALDAIWQRTINDGRMVRNFVQIVRSGKVGRKSLGSAPKRLVQSWFTARRPDQVWRQSIGNDPSLADVIKMVHPRPNTPEAAAVYAYLLDKPHDQTNLPAIVAQYERVKAGESREYANLPFMFLTALDLDTAAWTEIARTMTWQQLRMNLNTLKRHGVFENHEMVKWVASRLRDRDAILGVANVFPYQVMMAALAFDGPAEIQSALEDALDIALYNVPSLDGEVWVFPDVSGSMSSPVTGDRGRGATSKVRCIDWAALMSAALVRTNRKAHVVPFEQAVVDVKFNADDSVMENARRFSSVGGGGTNASASMRYLNQMKANADFVVYLSDNESWVDDERFEGRYSWYNPGKNTPKPTRTMDEWEILKARCPNAKMVCIDVQPYDTVQAPADRPDILHVGGFSDAVFDIMGLYARGELSAAHWVGEIERVTL